MPKRLLSVNETRAKVTSAFRTQTLLVFFLNLKYSGRTSDGIKWVGFFSGRPGIRLVHHIQHTKKTQNNSSLAIIHTILVLCGDSNMLLKLNNITLTARRSGLPTPEGPEEVDEKNQNETEKYPETWVDWTYEIAVKREISKHKATKRSKIPRKAGIKRS